MDNAELLARVHLAVEQHKHARKVRDAAIADALNAGIPHQAVADATGGLSQSACRKIRAQHDGGQK